MTDNHQNPPGDMDRGANQAGNEEEDQNFSGFWAELKKDPFAVVLSLATAGILIASVGLVVANIFLNLATGRLADATEALAKYAKEQGADTKAALALAQQSVAAAENLVKAVEKAGGVAQGNLVIAKEALEIQRVSGREALKQQRPHLAVFNVEIHNIDSTGSFLSDPLPIEARIYIRNIGPTRAIQIKGWAHVSVAPPKTTSFRTKGPDIEFQSNVLGNSLDEFGTASEKPNFPADSKEKILRGTSAIFVYGEVTYTDVLESTRYTSKFRYAFSGGSIPSDHIVRPTKAKSGGNDEQ
jgi:hypothetical protein